MTDTRPQPRRGAPPPCAKHHSVQPSMTASSNRTATWPGHRGVMNSPTTALACDSCGRLPHPHRLRLALVKLAAVFPVELLLHALVLHLHPPYALAVSILTITTTVLVIWVVEPSAMRFLRAWLHAPAVRARGHVHHAPALWRLRVTLDDEPGALEALAHALAGLDANILSLHMHPLQQGSRDELVVATPEHVRAHHLTAAIEAAGDMSAHVWPMTALALLDGPTQALTLAARVTADPGELPLAVAEMLGARVVTDRLWGGDARGGGPPDPAVLRIPSPWNGLFIFARDEPFTPAESARANRLAEIAEVASSISRPASTGAVRRTG